MTIETMSPAVTMRETAVALVARGNVPGPYVDRDEVARIDRMIAHHRLNIDESMKTAKRQYSAEHYVRTTALLPNELVAELRGEARRLAELNTRRIDITVPVTGNTPRKLGSLPNSLFQEHSKLFTALYNSSEFRSVLSDAVGSPVLDATFEDEKITGTHQNRAGDTHGWHWGDHEFAFIFIAEAPSIEHGGMLQSVPHTIWDKENPAVHEHLEAGNIRTYYHGAGESYFFKTDTSLHRTVPIQSEGVERIIINLTFASVKDWLEEKSYETTQAVYTD
ncbi:ArpA protein [Streptomyces sp. NPDC058195]|uniref:HalD/BesD family halogenase n=1 Tax=Streptomyces sp. NPDC058195 TaxID=3346375 RepID=UPI0036E96E3C